MTKLINKNLVILDDLMKAIEKEVNLAFYQLISEHATQLINLQHKIFKKKE